MPLFANMKVSSWVMDFMGWRLRLCNPQSIFSGYCIWIKLHHVGRHSAEIRFRYLHLQETNLSSHLRIVLYVMMACLFVLQELSTLSRGLYDAWPFKSSNSTEDSFIRQPPKTGSIAFRFPSTFNTLSQATIFVMCAGDDQRLSQSLLPCLDGFKWIRHFCMHIKILTMKWRQRTSI